MATIYGTYNNDQLVGTSSYDEIYGEAGNDELRGLGGGDYLRGGSENDLLVGGEGADTLYGDSGDDRYVFDRNFGQDYVYDYSGLNTIEFTELRQDQVQMTNTGGSLTIQVIGSTDSVQIESYSYYSDKFAFEFADAPPPPPTGPTEGADTLTGTAGRDEVALLGGNDTYRGLAGDDSIFGDDGNDILYGGDGLDGITGGLGNDTLYGEAGDDRLFPLDGADTVSGGAGNDVIGGGQGRDVRTGGTGRDVFSFGQSELGSRDLVTDFARGSDKLDLKSLDANTQRTGDQAFRFVGSGVPDTAGEVGFTKSGGNTIVRANTDSDSAIEFQIELTGNISLVSGDFVL